MVNKMEQNVEEPIKGYVDLCGGDTQEKGNKKNVK